MAILALTACNTKVDNPIFVESQSPFSAPEFSKIKTGDFMPAFQEAFKEQREEVSRIIANTEEPDFDNTIAALERSGKKVKKAKALFFNLNETDGDYRLRQEEKKILPLITEHNAGLTMNEDLWKRVKAVYDKKEKLNLDREQQMLLERYYQVFVDGGALLKADDKEKLKKVHKDLSVCLVEFSEHVLAENNHYELFIQDEKDLSGLPERLKEEAKLQAMTRGLDGWAFTFRKSCLLPFMTYADNRNLRKKFYTAYLNRCNSESVNDNTGLIRRILQLRLERAQLLGYKTFADYKLRNQMAASPKAVNDLLKTIWEAALPKAKEEAEALQQLIYKEGGHFKLEAWDWWYYAEKMRKEKFDFNHLDITPYLSLDNVREGAFLVAHKLFGITFKPITGLDVYNKEVKTYEVLDRDSSHLGLFYVDYYPRSTKHAGAWMNDIVSASNVDGENQRPVVLNVCNFPRPVGKVPSLLNIEGARTLFHEFGHALHSLLTKVKYPMIGGANVAHDFVEFPPQLIERWALEPEVLKLYARHYQTGETIPDSVIQKLWSAEHFNTGFETTELVSAAILDMELHMQTNYDDFNVEKFEKSVARKIGLIPQIAFRYRAPYFSHIFAGTEYSAGYYSYLWAEVLEADAFEAFQQKGLFDSETAALYRKFILEKGGSEQPMVLYKQFRGASPNPEAILRSRGLVNN